MAATYLKQLSSILASLSTFLGAFFGCPSRSASASALRGEGRSALQHRSWLHGFDVKEAWQVQQSDEWHANTAETKFIDRDCKDDKGETRRVNMNDAQVSRYGRIEPMPAVRWMVSTTRLVTINFST